MIKDVLKNIAKLLPASITKQLRVLQFNWVLSKTQKKHQIALEKIRQKDKIKVAFFLIHESVWKYEKVYWLLQNDDRFEPIVFVCPYITYGEENMLQEMNQAYEGFKEQGYNVVKTFDEKSRLWLDVKKEVKPDLVFFTNPHKLTRDEYYILNFLDTLTCYVPYNFGNSHLLKLFHDQDLHNFVWTLFAESEIHKEYSNHYARNKGTNVFVSGFPGTDNFLTDQEEVSDIWKNEEVKKIIWAPHHTIDDGKSAIKYSSFKIYYQYMYSLLDQYKGKIEIIFKPHPILKIKLYNDKEWGKEKTDAYYESWANHPFGGLNDSDYTNLFKTSDALIHDSGSFLIEYLYTGKPVLRTDRDDSIPERLNSFGKMAYEVHYIAKNQNHIDDFLNKIIHNEEDILKEKRKDFKNKYLLQPDNKTASEIIFNYIKKQTE